MVDSTDSVPYDPYYMDHITWIYSPTEAIPYGPYRMGLYLMNHIISSRLYDPYHIYAPNYIDHIMRAI